MPERWIVVAVIVGLLARIPAVMAHLAIGLFIYGGRIDFVSYFLGAVGYANKLVAGGQQLPGHEWSFFTFSDTFEHQLGVGTSVIDRLWTIVLLMVGPSLPAMFLVSGLIGFTGAYLFVRAFQSEFPDDELPRFLVFA